MQLLVHYSSLDAAATWALRYNLPDDKLPCGVGDAMKVLRLHERYRQSVTRHTLGCRRLQPKRCVLVIIVLWGQPQDGHPFHWPQEGEGWVFGATSDP